MTTRLSDLVQHDKEFLATVFQKMTDRAVMRRAGVVLTDAALNERANGAGKITSIPFWNTLAQNESNVSSDDPAVHSTPDGITQGEQLAVRNFRNRSWSAMDVEADLLADDPMGAIAKRVGEYWAVDEDKTILSIITGIMLDNIANNSADMTVGDGTGALDVDLLIDGAGTAGDAASMFKTLICHSKVYQNLQKQQANTFVPVAKTDIGFAQYAGYNIIVSDMLPVNAGVYTSVLVTDGAILAGEGNSKVPVEVFRDPSAGNGGGQESLYNRRQFILHPNGMKFTGTPAGLSPTNTEFAADAAWARAYNRKNVGLAFVKTNG